MHRSEVSQQLEQHQRALRRVPLLPRTWLLDFRSATTDDDNLSSLDLFSITSSASPPFRCRFPRLPSSSSIPSLTTITDVNRRHLSNQVPLLTDPLLHPLLAPTAVRHVDFNPQAPRSGAAREEDHRLGRRAPRLFESHFGQRALHHRVAHRLFLGLVRLACEPPFLFCRAHR